MPWHERALESEGRKMVKAAAEGEMSKRKRDIWHVGE